jgi:hypothetical protein
MSPLPFAADHLNLLIQHAKDSSLIEEIVGILKKNKKGLSNKPLQIDLYNN